MPFYRFQLEVPMPPQAVMQRIAGLVRTRPSFWQSFTEPWKPRDPAQPPFIGEVDQDSFKFSRKIYYRNSFLPRISGYVLPTPTGTQINVTMYLHPFAAVFVTIWLSLVGMAAVTTFFAESTSSLIPAGMFLFGVALTCGAFFAEAFKAKRILTAALSDSAITSPHPPAIE